MIRENETFLRGEHCSGEIFVSLRPWRATVLQGVHCLCCFVVSIGSGGIFVSLRPWRATILHEV